MLVEPVGTMMSAQAQTISTQNQSSSSFERATEVTGSEAQKANKIDDSTVVVEEASQKGTGYNESEEQQATSEQIKKAVENLNKKMAANSEAVFGFHEGTNRVTIKLVDKSTKEVIKELPPEKTLDMIARVWEMAGILVDEKR